MRKFLFPETSSLPAWVGLLVLRVVTGVAMAMHGWPKFQGPTTGMNPTTPGSLQILAAVAEFFGGISLMVGFLTPIAAAGIFVTMVVASWTMRSGGAVWVNPTGGNSYEISALYGAVALLFVFIGPGALSLDAFLFARKGRKGQIVAGR